MKFGTVILCALAAALAAPAAAQPLKEAKRVKNVEITDLENNAVKLPYFGEKNLMIFYVDPDKHKQNQDFTDDMEANHQIASDNLYGFGIINLKDAPMFPNSLVRSITRKRTAKNGATVLTDADRILANEWGLGDCNNKFVLLIVSKEGELVYMHKGELSPEDITEFYEFVEKYR